MTDDQGASSKVCAFLSPADCSDSIHMSRYHSTLGKSRSAQNIANPFYLIGINSFGQQGVPIALLLVEDGVKTKIHYRFRPRH